MPNHGNRGRTGPAWNEARNLCFTLHTGHDGHITCTWCGNAIDMQLSGRHNLGPTVDHITALDDGGPLLDQANLAPMHRTCNVRKENDRRRQRRAGKAQGTTRAW